MTEVNIHDPVELMVSVLICACLSLLSIVTSWALLCKRKRRRSPSALFPLYPSDTGRLRGRKVTCRNRGGDAEKSLRNMGVGQKVSTAARDTVGNVA